MTEREGPQSPRSSGSTTSSVGSGCFPWTVLAVVIALVSGLFLFLGSSDEPGSGRPGGSRQQAYVDEIDEARQQLFKGELVRTSTKSMHLVAGGDPIPFRAQILGSWRSDGAGETHSRTSAGAQIGVKLHCSGAQVRCTPLSSERQNVISKKDAATWLWDVSAEKAGTVTLSVTVTAYYQDSDTVLLEQPPATAHVQVAAPPGDSFGRAEQAWRWISGVITSLGGLAVSLTALITLAVLLTRRTTPAADSETGHDDTDADTNSPS
ncbi:hypothetical protein ACFC18_51890 [Streptomyces sp. NPDC056121]|uniref:hypothetical protein n=1 Tax=Streptomyces TaxID=1883 RepID=UPI001D0A9B4D|nr:hypothetical protein [Streptomyces longhuiensis]UDM04103.1 hypothetical protein LGI35_40555 [Streptomyces longhuiensis]